MRYLTRDIRIRFLRRLKEKTSSEKQYRNKVTAAYQHEKQFIGGVAAEDFNRIVSSAVEKLLKKGE